MSRKYHHQKTSFFKTHADAIAIVGVNLALIAICVSVWIGESMRIDAANARIDSANARSDQLHNEFYDLLKEMRR